MRGSPRNQRGGVIAQGPAWVGHTPGFGLQFLQLKIDHAHIITHQPVVRGGRPCLPPLTPLLGPLRALGILHGVVGDQGFDLAEGVSPFLELEEVVGGLGAGAPP